MARKKESKALASRREATDLAGIAEFDDEVDVDEDDSMLEILGMLKEFQKRKTTKASTASNAFQTKKNALYTSARKSADSALRDGVAYIEQYQSRLADLRAQEVSQEQHLHESMLLKETEDAMENLSEVFSPLFEDLSYRRVESVNDSSAMLEVHTAQRQRSRMKLIKQAKARIDEDMENQRIATDATALIKHYKALLVF
ncbi:hypothetical protein EIP86_010805 [Pleurotus ostreatoroseus]|nr:hypothetical protein EIP86_010805 [Pleurotus ostreatoroseus]